MGRKSRKPLHIKRSNKFGPLGPKRQNSPGKELIVRKMVPVKFKHVTLKPKEESVEDLLRAAGNDAFVIHPRSLVKLTQTLRIHKKPIETHFSRLLKISTTAFSNESPSIRKSGFRLFCLLLETFPTCIQPFQLIPHLCSAMTSIHLDVRMDSFKILDVCLDTIPFVITSSEKIVADILKGISLETIPNYETCMSYYDSDSQPNMPLNWRTRVLYILTKYINTIIRHLSREKECFIPICFSPPVSQQILLPKPMFSDVYDYISSLMSSLLSLWSEAAPSPIFNTGAFTLTSATAAATMHSVLIVIRLIGKWMKVLDAKQRNSNLIHLLNNKFRQQIRGHLFMFFPYDVFRERRRSTVDAAVCFRINLSICSVYAMLPHSASETKLFQIVSNHVLHAVHHFDGSKVALVSIVSEILKGFVATCELKHFDPHLNGLVEYYKAPDLGRKGKREILDLITDLISDINNRTYLENVQMMPPLMQSILQNLLKMHQNSFVDEHLLGVVNQLTDIAFKPFINALQENSFIFIECLQSKQEAVQKTAVKLISRIPLMPPHFLQHLAKAVFNPVVKIQNISHLLDLLYALCDPIQEAPFPGKDFANFLTCLLVGMFIEETNVCYNTYHGTLAKYGSSIPFHLSQYVITDSKDLQRHFDISQAVMKILMSFPNKHEMFQFIHAFVVTFTTAWAYFPSHAGLGILLLEAEAYERDYKPENTNCLSCINEIIIALCIYHVAWEKRRDACEISKGCILESLCSTIKRMNNMRHLCEIFISRIGDLNFEQAKCVGRLMLIAIWQELVPPADMSEIRRVFQELHVHFGDRALKEPWWNYSKESVKAALDCEVW